MEAGRATFGSQFPREDCRSAVPVRMGKRLWGGHLWGGISGCVDGRAFVSDVQYRGYEECAR